MSVPFANIKITKENATPEQKAALIKDVTELPRDILGKIRPPRSLLSRKWIRIIGELIEKS